MGLPVRICSSPYWSMITVPQAWQSPRMPGSLARAMKASINSFGKVGTVLGK